jgi:uracil-DNA glycosylase
MMVEGIVTSSALIDEIRACTLCASHLSAGPRPIVQFSATSRILIIGQAPGIRVHASGVPWDDPSGDRLREWTGLSAEDFYDPTKVALMPMGFCYPGTGASGDLPPRPECAPLWHERVLTLLPLSECTQTTITN